MKDKKNSFFNKFFKAAQEEDLDKLNLSVQEASLKELEMVLSYAIQSQSTKVIAWAIDKGFKKATECHRAKKSVAKYINPTVWALLKENTVVFNKPKIHQYLLQESFRIGNFKFCDILKEEKAKIDINIEKFLYIIFSSNQWKPYEIRYILDNIIEKKTWIKIHSYLIDAKVNNINIFSLSQIMIEYFENLPNITSLLQVMIHSYEFDDEWKEDKITRNAFAIEVFLNCLNKEKDAIINWLDVIESVKVAKVKPLKSDVHKNAQYVEDCGITLTNAICSHLIKFNPQLLQFLGSAIKGWESHHNKLLLKYLIQEEIEVIPLNS